MRAMDVMTTQVVTVAQDTAVKTISGLLLKHGISAVPVIDAEDHIIGLVSEGDLMRRLDEVGSKHRSWWLDLVSSPRSTAVDYVKIHGQHARDVMTRDVVTVTVETPIGDIAKLLETHRIKRVPVVRDGKLVGIVSRANLLHGLASTASESAAPPSPDNRQLRDRAIEALAAVPAINMALINVIVNDGVTEIWGVVDSDEQEHAIRVAIENIEGVKNVDIHLGRLPDWAWGL